jgi:hypothetical protein
MTAAILIVEGDDERDVVDVLCRLHALSGFAVENLGGRGNLQKLAKSIATDSKFRDVSKVGIIFDSEDDPELAQRELAQAVQVLQNGKRSKTVSVLQLPAPDQAGSIEAMCLQAIDQNDPVLHCCDQLLTCLASEQTQMTTQARRDKLKLLTWYAATNAKTISRIGYDATKDQKFNFSHRAFQPIVDLLRKLSV